MSCYKFGVLSREITSLCLEKGVSNKSRDYLINRASNYIRKDYLEYSKVIFSLEGFNNNEHVYIVTHKIDCPECSLYMCLVID